MKALVDASVAIPFVHPEDVSPAVRRWLVGWMEAGSTLVVPSHFWLEVVNSLTRRHGYEGTSVLEAIHELRQLPIETVEIDEPAIVLVIDVIERHGLSAYDAEYLALAEQLNVPLVTLDRRLAAAAGSLAIDSIDPTGPSFRLTETQAPYGSPAAVTWPDYARAASYLASMRAQLTKAEGDQPVGQPRPAQTATQRERFPRAP